MAVSYDDFWGRMQAGAPGMIQAGMGLYGAIQGPKEAERRLRAAQGPVYDASMAGAKTALDQAGSMDPQAFAQQRLNQQHALLSGKDAADETALMRMLYSKGMLDSGVYNPGVEGIQPGATVMNPQLAAFYAGRGARDAKMAVDAYDQGQKQIDTYVNRAGNLQGTAANTQTAGMAARGKLPSRTDRNMQIVKSFGDIAKSTGMLQKAGDWLKAAFTGAGSFRSDPYSYFSGGQGLEDVLSGFSSSDDWWSSVF